jgi:hypothetical protein
MLAPGGQSEEPQYIGSEKIISKFESGQQVFSGKVVNQCAELST